MFMMAIGISSQLSSTVTVHKDLRGDVIFRFPGPPTMSGSGHLQGSDWESVFLMETALLWNISPGDSHAVD